MNFFDDLIDEVKKCLSSFDKKSYKSAKMWRDVGRNEVVLQRDSAYELDGIGFNLVTSKPIGDSEVVVIGSELNQITAGTRFARISIIEMQDVEDEQKAYNLIRKVEYAKYHYFPQGFMVRTASTSHKEMVRISKSALADGLSFEGVGNLLINKYKENNSVKSVKIIYVTDKMADYDKLESIAKKNYDITETLNHIMQNINFDCSTCNLKPICDEVEGMRELHFKNAGM
jgi:CO dehydrogenase/acetyl-CoA synthase beta subunit